MTLAHKPDALQSEIMAKLDAATIQQVNQALEAAHAPETKRVYGIAWEAWEAWATERDLATLPASPEAVAAYLAHKAKQPQSNSYAALNLARAAIGHQHKQKGYASPCEHPGVKAVLRGLAKQDTRQARQAAPLTATALAAIEATATRPRKGRGGHLESEATATWRGKVDIALCRVLRDGLLRRSEAAALRWKDLMEAEDGSATIELGKTKTEEAGTVCYMSAATVQALQAIRLPHLAEDARIFNLTGVQIAARIKAAAKAAGLQGNFNGHSGRVGMAQDLSAAGAELPALMEAGRWRSSAMPARYTKHQAAARGAVARYYQEKGA